MRVQEAVEEMVGGWMSAVWSSEGGIYRQMWKPGHCIGSCQWIRD